MTHIFADSGHRWTKFKTRVLITGIVIGSLFGGILYLIIYNPHPATKPLANQKIIDQVIAQSYDQGDDMIGAGSFVDIDYTYDHPRIRRFGDGPRMVALTFDDGPNAQYTPQVLQVLEQQHIKGTFFVTAAQVIKNPQLVEQMRLQGHDIGLHSYSHQYIQEDATFKSLRSILEFDIAQKVLAYHLGYKTNVFRVPFLGQDNEPDYHSQYMIGEALKRGMIISAPTVDSLDWQVQSTEQLYKNATTQNNNLTPVILFHDSGGDSRARTIETLPQIIQFYRDQGYQFVTVDQLAKHQGLVTRYPLTPQDKLAVKLVNQSIQIMRQTAKEVLTVSLVASLLFLLLHSLSLMLAAAYSKIRARRRIPTPDYHPQVSILIPMYNEQYVIANTVESILQSDYPDFNIHVVNDGSTDNSLQVLKQLKHHPQVHVHNQANQGKVAALNHGIAMIQSPLIITVDADTQLNPNAISQIVSYFADPHIGCVSGSVRVGNRNSAITKSQDMEYTIAQSLDKRAMDLLHAVTISPGAFSAWRKAALIKAGQFTPDTLAEDFDLTLRAIQQGYRSKYCPQSIAYTEVPADMQTLSKQRFRWYYGNLQVLFKHRHLFFNPDYGILGLFWIPRMWIWQIFAQLFLPVIDLFVIIGIVIGNTQVMLIYFVIYVVMQMIVAAFAYRLESRPLPSLFTIMFVRVWYSHRLSFILWRACISALRGQIVQWNIVHHQGLLKNRLKALVN